MNYFVPHFGEDDDISASKSNMAEAESKLGAWVLPEKKDADPEYTVPNWGYDQDIEDTMASIKSSET